MSGSEAPAWIQEAILALCGQLKDDAVALVDAIAPPDFILNSPIGMSDGQVKLGTNPILTSHFVACVFLIWECLATLKYYLYNGDDNEGK